MRVWPWAALAFLGLSVLAWQPVPPGLWHDDGVYLVVGQALAEGEGLRYGGVPGEVPAVKFPPLYPVVVGVVWWLAPSFPDNGAVFALMNLLFLAGAGWLFLRWARALGLPWPWSVGAVGAAVVSPDLWRPALVPLSEPLFLLLLAATLLVARRLEAWRPADLAEGAEGADGRGGEGSGRWPRLVAWLVLYALLAHTRSIGVVVGAALPLALVLRGRRTDAAFAAAGAVAVTLPWLVWSSTQGESIAEPLRDVLGPYGPWLGGQLPSEPLTSLSTLAAGTVGWVDRILLLVVPRGPDALRWLLAPFVVVLLLQGVRALGRRSGTAAWTLGLYLVVLWVWPFRELRLFAPALPLVTVAVAFGARDLAEAGGGRVPGLARGAVVLWGAALAGSGVVGLLRGSHVEPYDIRAEMLERAAGAVREATPGTAVVGAPELWAALHLYTGRRAAPSAPFRPLSTEGPSWGTPGDQFVLWDAAGIDHVLLELGGVVHREALDELDARCPGAVRVVASWRGGALVRLAWDEACRTRVAPLH